MDAVFLFQSPSLRGSGRFGQGGTHGNDQAGGFNPLHCGAVVASNEDWVELDPVTRVSIPFIAGQWSLPCVEDIYSELQCYVSIPFIAGQWSLLEAVGALCDRRVPVSIPFIAGQWSLPNINSTP